MLDLEEIKKIENTTCFTKANVEGVILYFFYIDNHNLETIETDFIEIYNNLSEKSIHSKFTEHKYYNGKTYTLSGLHSYNFNVNSLSEYVESEKNNNFVKYTSIRNIEFPKTIEEFNDYTSLFFILENKKKKIMTKKANEVLKKKAFTLKNV